MYISTSTYGGIDWHDSSTIYKQLKSNGSYKIGENEVSEAIADDIAKDFPYVENVREKVLQALSEKSCFRFMIKSEENDNVSYEANGKIFHKNEAVFDGDKRELTLDFDYGQVSYTTTYYLEDIPDDQLGYIVTEDFLAPAKGVDLVERLYHDIFNESEAAQNYANSLKLHEFDSPKSIATFLVCNKSTVSQTKWYRQQKEAMKLMEEKGQTYLDDSFCIFTQNHIEKLKSLSNGKETVL